MDNLIKICGLSTPETLDVALGAGADMVGFVRFPKSPRHVSLDLGHRLSLQARGRAQRVVLLVDPTDEAIAQAIEAINPDLIQLHGGESPERVAEIRRPHPSRRQAAPHGRGLARRQRDLLRLAAPERA